MDTKRFFIVIEADGKRWKTKSISDADQASKRGAEVVEIVKVRYQIGPTTVKIETSTLY